MSLRDLIDRAVRCVKCGAPLDPPCRCWVRLECPSCGRTQRDDRQPGDGDADVLLITCPDCLPAEEETPP